MAVIKSGATTDQLTVDPTSKAARVTTYDTSGNVLGTATNPLIVNGPQKATYRAATAVLFAAAAGTAPFFAIQGSATKLIRVQRIVISGVASATLGVDRINVAKYSTAISGGTSVVLTQVPLDSNSAAGTANLVNVYTAAPTPGTKIGDIASRAILAKSTTIAEGAGFMEVTFDFRVQGEVSSVILRGVAQNIACYFNVAPAAIANVQVEVEWTEE